MFLASAWNTTPWDVREHATYWDIIRFKEMNISRDKAEKNKAIYDKAKQTAKAALSH